MFRSKLHITFIFLFMTFCIIGTHVLAQQNSKAPITLFPILKKLHNRKTRFPPKAILVMLRSESAKLQYCKANKKNKEWLNAQKDASNIRRVMKNDFEENFHFCPVYYFIDTFLDLVIQQDFENHVFTANGIPMPASAIHRGDTNYFIVYYGYPEDQMAIDEGDTTALKAGSAGVLGKGLVFLNYRNLQVDYYVKFDYMTIFANPDSRYYFKSTAFDMEYYPFAADYNSDLEWAYRGIPKVKKLNRYKP